MMANHPFSSGGAFLGPLLGGLVSVGSMALVVLSFSDTDIAFLWNVVRRAWVWWLVLLLTGAAAAGALTAVVGYWVQEHGTIASYLHSQEWILWLGMGVLGGLVPRVLALVVRMSATVIRRYTHRAAAEAAGEAETSFVLVSPVLRVFAATSTVSSQKILAACADLRLNPRVIQANDLVMRIRTLASADLEFARYIAVAVHEHARISDYAIPSSIQERLKCLVPDHPQSTGDSVAEIEALAFELVAYGWPQPVRAVLGDL